MRRFSLFMVAGMLFWPLMAQGCSETTACEVPEGVYHIATPDVPAEDSPPAVIFVHGFGSTGPAVFRNRGMVEAFLQAGYVFAAPTGMPRGNGNGASWGFHPDLPRARDEIAFLSGVRDDLIAKHNVDPERIVLAGFSIGGTMVSYLACAAPEAFAAYAPVGGNFWRPHPTECNGPVRMLHTHGWTDKTVPLEGRVLRGADANVPGALVQGDIFHAMVIWRETNGCTQLAADSFVTDAQYLRRRWERCAEGSALELALFPGGHMIPRDWPDMVTDWFEGL